MRWLMLVGLLACTKRVDTAAALAVEAHAEQASASDTDTVERSTRTAGPVDVVTVTEVFGPAAEKKEGIPAGEPSRNTVPRQAANGSGRWPDIGASTSATESAPRQASDGLVTTLPDRGPLLKRITRTEHRGPVEAEKTRATQAETASTATRATKTTASTTTHSVSAPAWHIPLWGFLALLLIGAGIYLFKRFA